MDLYLSTRFLKRLFQYLYYHIAPNIELWGREAAVLLVPECVIRIRDNVVIDCRLIDEIMNPDFRIEDLRQNICFGVASLNGSWLEQVLISISDGFLELPDTPGHYPGERLGDFMQKWLDKNQRFALQVDGICHFHPVLEGMSPADAGTMKNVSKIMSGLGQPKQLSLVIAADPSIGYLGITKSAPSDFVKFMLSHIDSMLFEAIAFHDTGETEALAVYFLDKPRPEPFP